MFDVVALGEALIDLTPAGTNEVGMALLARNPGGAPANVLAMRAKLGGKTAFIGKVGRDAFGAFLKENMESAGIDLAGLCMDEAIPTTLALVQLNSTGDRSFSFYRKPGADIMLRQQEVPLTLLQNCRIFHFGSVSLTDQPCRDATLWAAQQARQAGALVSYDPNYRPLLWRDPAFAVEQMRSAMRLAHLVKLSDEELFLLTGLQELEAGAAELRSLGPAVVVVTQGAKGAFVQTASVSAQRPAYQVTTVDTTGAGDAFWGALLYRIAGLDCQGLQALSSGTWGDILAFANAAGGLTTTKPGAIPAMPDLPAIRACIAAGL